MGQSDLFIFHESQAPVTWSSDWPHMNALQTYCFLPKDKETYSETKRCCAGSVSLKTGFGSILGNCPKQMAACNYTH